MRWVRLIGVLLVAATVATGALVLERAIDEEINTARVTSDENGGEAAPELSGVDVMTGEEVDLADFRGKPVVINVWTSQCSDCRAEARDLYRFAKAHPEAHVVGIDVGDTMRDGRAFRKEFSWFWPVLFDDDASIAAALDLTGLPETLFLNADHEIVARIVGAGDLESLEEGLRVALGG